jgi:hypothetical protein
LFSLEVCCGSLRGYAIASMIALRVWLGRIAAEAFFGSGR